MKIEFEKFLGTYICHFFAGGKHVVIEDVYRPEKFASIEDFFGNLATRALEQAVEDEKREYANKVVRNFIEESAIEFRPLSASAITKLYKDAYRYPSRLVDVVPNKSKCIALGKCNPVEVMPPHIEKVIFDSPATIVFWSDGDKTVVKATNELFDREKGLAMAIAKKFLGNKGNYFDTFKKYIK